MRAWSNPLYAVINGKDWRFVQIRGEVWEIFWGDCHRNVLATNVRKVVLGPALWNCFWY